MKLLELHEIFLTCCCIEVVRWPFQFCTIWVSAISTEVVPYAPVEYCTKSVLMRNPFMAISYKYIENIPVISWIYHRMWSNMRQLNIAQNLSSCATPPSPPQTKRCDWCPKLFFADWWLLDLPRPFLWSYHTNILNKSLILVEYTTDVVQYAPAVHCTNFVLMRKTMESVWSTVGFGRDSMWKLRKMRFKEAAYLAYLGSAQQIYKKFTAFRVWNHENCVQWWSLKIQHTWSAEQYAL